MRFAVIHHTLISGVDPHIRTDAAYFTGLTEATAYFETRPLSDWHEYELVSLLATRSRILDPLKEETHLLNPGTANDSECGYIPTGHPDA